MLFPYSYGSFCERIDNRLVLTQVVLPDDRTLNFAYNEYGEVVETTLPTGGKIQYDYAYEDNLPTGNSPLFETNGFAAPGFGGFGDVKEIDRAVIARRTYPDGTAQEGSWSYAYSATTTVGHATNGYTDVQARDSGNTLLSSQRVLFKDAQQYRTAQGGTGYSLWSTGLEWRSETRDGSGNVLAASEQDWSQRAPVVWTTGYSQEQPANDNRVNESRKILETGQTARVTTLYDQFNNPTETGEYDFDGTLKRRSVTSYSSTNLVNGVNYADDSIRLIRLPLQQSIYDGAGIEQARNVTEYDIYTGDGNHYDLLSYGTITGHDTANYGLGRTTRGNTTRIGNWIKTTNSYLYSYPRYDIPGNIVSTKDANGNVVTVSFVDDFGDGGNPGGGVGGTYGATYALPTLITSPPPTPGAPVHTARNQYDFSTGLLTGFRDRNNIVTQTLYNDAFNRPTQVKSALGVTGVESHAAMFYPPATACGITLVKNDVLTVSDQTTLDDAVLCSWTRTDGFGRPTESWKRDPQGDTKVIANYDGLGRARQTSNPFRPSLGETAVYSTTAYDLAGRVISVTTPDSAVVTTSYSGNQVVVTDQMLKKRMSQSDALGRLTDVWEITAADTATETISFPGHSFSAGYRTRYVYDTLDNLTMVTQGTQQRYFMYDSLKRLIRGKNPEQGVNASLNLTDPVTGNSQWSVGYTYDNNGNLTQRTDSRGFLSIYEYDALNRNKTVDYSDTTGINPDFTRIYDSATNGKGRLRESYAGGSETVGTNVEHTRIHSYDALGRPQDQRQRFKTNGSWSAEYQTQRTYNLAGGCHVADLSVKRESQLHLRRSRSR